MYAEGTDIIESIPDLEDKALEKLLYHCLDELNNRLISQHNLDLKRDRIAILGVSYAKVFSIIHNLMENRLYPDSYTHFRPNLLVNSFN